MTVWHESLGSDIWQVSVSGRLDQTQTRELEDQLTKLFDETYIYFIIDLAETSYINSGGLRCLVAAWRKAKQRGGNLLICGLDERLQEIFSMVGFHRVFQIYPNVASARKEIIYS